MARNPYTTVDALCATARHRGYEPVLGDWDGEDRVLRITGHGETFQARFRLSDDRNLVWAGGLRGGVTIRTARRLRELLETCARIADTKES